MIMIYSANPETGRIYTDQKQHFYIDSELLHEKKIYIKTMHTLDKIAKIIGYKSYSELSTCAACHGFSQDALYNLIVSGQIVKTYPFKTESIQIAPEQCDMLKGDCNMYSLAGIARKRIGHNNPFPQLEGLPADYEYGCKYGLTDIYPEYEKVLRNAIDTRKIFDTDWIPCKKEIRSFRMISDGKVLTVMASEEMDDFDDLIYDAQEEESDFTEDQIEELNELWIESDMGTYTESEETIELTTYEKALSVIEKLEETNSNILKDRFEIVKKWVKEITSR